MSDPYVWMENLKDSRVLEFIQKHNERFKNLVRGISEEYIEKIKKYYDVPTIIDIAPSDKGIYFIIREGMEYKIKLLTTRNEIYEIISSNDIGENVLFRSITSREDGERIAFFYTIAGSDEGYVKIMNPFTHETIDELKGTAWDIVWVRGDEYFYSRFYRKGKTPDGAEAPAERILLRNPATGEEIIVFGKEYGTNYQIDIYKPWKEDRVFIIVEYGWHKTKIYSGPLKNPEEWQLLFDGGDNRVKPIGFYGKDAYLIYYDGEGLGRIVKVSDNREISEIISEDKYPLRKGVLYRDKLFLEYLVDAHSDLRMYSLEGELIKQYKFNQPLTIELLSYDDNNLYLVIESFNIPRSLYTLGGDSIYPVIGYSSIGGIEVSEEWAKSSDGTLIHMFIVKNPEKDNGKAIVYGYGGFGISITPYYLGPFHAFLEEGGWFVMANLRGGGEYGEKWHKMGMKDKKQNVFEDYKAVLTHIRNKGLKTIGWGVSNGGLLVAATLVQSPELFNAAIIGYPVIDMLRFHKLYIGKLWTTEYGNPDNPEDREYLAKYSPYHNIDKNKKYPPTLVYTGLHDDRVHPAHALKFVARMEKITSNIYLRVETKSGHMGSSPKVKIKEYADILAFIKKTIQ